MTDAKVPTPWSLMGELLKSRMTTDVLRSNDRLVLLAFLAHADVETGKTWVSVRTIAADTGLSRATVCRAIANLRELGLMTRSSRPSPSEPHVVELRGLELLLRDWDVWRYAVKLAGEELAAQFFEWVHFVETERSLGEAPGSHGEPTQSHSENPTEYVPEHATEQEESGEQPMCTVDGARLVLHPTS